MNLFSGETWDEFRRAGADVSGFRASKRKLAAQVQPGDVLLCYLTGVMRWVGALKVKGPSQDTRPIWRDDFPVRFDVVPLVMLEAENGVPMQELEGKMAFYEGPEQAGKYKGFVRGSPNLFKREGDGELLLNLLTQAEQHPVARPVDQKKLYRAERKEGKQVVEALVSVPEKDEPRPKTRQPALGLATRPSDEEAETTRHTEIQYHLLAVGAEMGLDVWVARNDRSRSWKGHTLGKTPRLVNTLPTQFNEATQRTIELIDVLWLRGNSIVAAFEVECTTSVYSGLLRMSDLLALQPNLDIRLYLVAPDERRAKVAQEIRRPTFQLRQKPLHTVCGFLPFSILMEKIEGIRRLKIASSVSPSFLEEAAEYFRE